MDIVQPEVDERRVSVASESLTSSGIITFAASPRRGEEEPTKCWSSLIPGKETRVFVAFALAQFRRVVIEGPTGVAVNRESHHRLSVSVGCEYRFYLVTSDVLHNLIRI